MRILFGFAAASGPRRTTEVRFASRPAQCPVPCLAGAGAPPPMRTSQQWEQALLFLNQMGGCVDRGL
eukprot:12560502-Alexandrium_andersonii.AAC.1